MSKAEFSDKAGGYPVPAATVRVETAAGNSRFIATAARADTVESARTFIRGVREEMPEAPHHVYAYKIGHGKNVTEGMSDDGEPSGTSGPPALAVLRGAEVGDCVVVVTRYFGGTKLGTGGLVQAYGEAVRAVLAALRTEPKIARVGIALTVGYAQHDTVRRLLEEYAVAELAEEFGEAVTVRCNFPVVQVGELRDRVRDATAGKVGVEKL